MLFNVGFLISFGVMSTPGGPPVKVPLSLGHSTPQTNGENFVDISFRSSQREAENLSRVALEGKFQFPGKLRQKLWKARKGNWMRFWDDSPDHYLLWTCPPPLDALLDRYSCNFTVKGNNSILPVGTCVKYYYPDYYSLSCNFYFLSLLVTTRYAENY